MPEPCWQDAAVLGRAGACSDCRDLQQNKIEELPPGVFDKLTQLTALWVFDVGVVALGWVLLGLGHGGWNLGEMHASALGRPQVLYAA